MAAPTCWRGFSRCGHHSATTTTTSVRCSRASRHNPCNAGPQGCDLSQRLRTWPPRPPMLPPRPPLALHTLLATWRAQLVRLRALCGWRHRDHDHQPRALAAHAVGLNQELVVHTRLGLALACTVQRKGSCRWAPNTCGARGGALAEQMYESESTVRSLGRREFTYLRQRCGAGSTPLCGMKSCIACIVHGLLRHYMLYICPWTSV